MSDTKRCGQSMVHDAHTWSGSRKISGRIVYVTYWCPGVPAYRLRVVAVERCPAVAS